MGGGEVTGGWIKWLHDELHDLNSSPDICQTIKSRTVRWAEHMARTRGNRSAYRFLVGKSERKRSTWES